jgi:hypothetical protein
MNLPDIRKAAFRRCHQAEINKIVVIKSFLMKILPVEPVVYLGQT